MIASAIQKFRFDTGQYPEELADLTSVEVPDYLEIDEDKWKGPYIEDVNSFTDPWENEYQYRMPGEIHEDSYDLWSNGIDGEESTEDDLTNWTEED